MSSSRWFALYVKSRHEQATETFLRHKGYETFCPTYQSRRIWSDRVKEVALPLFPNYLFCRFSIHDRTVPVLGTPGVSRIVGLGDHPTPIEESEIAALQKIVSSRNAVMPWPYLQEGTGVRIERGPLSGISGILISLRKHHRLIVSVSLLRRSVAVEVERTWVAPLRVGMRTQAAAGSI